MVLGFLCSRLFLSLGMIFFGLNAVRGIPPRQWFRWRWWWLGMGWVGLFALSWFWSTDPGSWNDHVQVKLPFLFLPFAFALLPPFSQRQYQVYTLGMCGLLLGGIGYSLSFFITDPHTYIEGYSFSHVIPTPVYRDHIRFSAGLAMAVAWCIYIWPRLAGKGARILVAAACTVFVLYLHLLAARTGLLMVYGLALLLIFRFIWKKHVVAGLGLLLLMIAMLWVGYREVPTLRQRLRYVQYSYDLLRDGKPAGNYSDHSRLLSYDVALRKTAEHPWLGVGAGDIVQSMDEGYDRWHPEVKKENRLVPHNQLLVVSLAVGLPGALVFLAWLLYPLCTLRRGRDGFFLLCSWLMLLLPLMVEPMLEVQFGVFVYLFFLLWQWHAMRSGAAFKRNDDTDP